MTHSQIKLSILSEDEMEDKFESLQISNLLKECRKQTVDRDPNVNTFPPFSSVKHKREHGIKYTTEANDFIALIFYWYDATGEERRSIRQFFCPQDGTLYRVGPSSSKA